MRRLLLRWGIILSVAGSEKVRGWHKLWRKTVAEPAVPSPSGEPQVDSGKAVRLALAVAARAVQCGALTTNATAMALTVLDAYQVSAQVDVTWTSVTISYVKPGQQDPVTGFRSVRNRGMDFTMLTNLVRLMDEVGSGELSLSQAQQRFANLPKESYRYRRWVDTLAQAVAGAAVAAILGGRIMEILLAAVAGVLLHLTMGALKRTPLSMFFVFVGSAAVPTAMAVVIMYLRSLEIPWAAQLSPSIIVAAGIVKLLSGVGFAGAARDALDGNYLTALARSYEAIIHTAGIVVGAVAVLWIGWKLGVPGYLAPADTLATPTAALLLWAGLLTLSVGISYHLVPEALGWVFLLGAAGYAAYLYGEPLLGDATAAVALGSFVIGFLAQSITGRIRVPVVALVTVGTVAFVPGLALYRGLYALTGLAKQLTSVQAEVNLVTALGVALAIAAGVALGSQLSRPLGLSTSHFFRRASYKSYFRWRRR